MPLTVLPSALDQTAVKQFREDMPAGVIPEKYLEVASNIAGGSPYLRQLMLRDQEFAKRAFAEDPDILASELLEYLRQQSTGLDLAEVMRLLRKTKARARHF